MSKVIYPELPIDVEAMHDVFDLVRKAISIAEMSSRVQVASESDADMLKDACNVTFELLEEAKHKMLTWDKGR